MKELIENLMYFGFYKESESIQLEFDQWIQFCLENSSILELEYTPAVIENEKVPEKVVPEKVKKILGSTDWKI
jgi:hypothetical protein